MTIDHLSRRSAIATLGIGAAAMTINEASAQTPAAAPAAVPAFAGNHQVKPLRFNPARLHGLSERLITSHHENNYAGSVKALNMIETRLAAALADTDLPPVVYGGLKREELHRTGSVVLHEVYFDGLGGNGGIAESGRKRTLRPVLVERSGNGSGFNVSGARIAGDQRSFFFSDFSIIQRWNQCAARKTKAMKITTGISIPSWPGLGVRKSVTATMADKIQEAKAGVIASAKTRGAVQFTDPSNAHCMGNRTSLRKRALARKDMRISRPIAMRAMIDWIISALPVDQNVSG